MKDFLEIERRYLIRYPGLNYLNTKASSTHIVQTYLLPQAEWDTRRIRKRGAEGKFVYTYTRKKRISALTRLEDEREIGEEEYLKLLSEKDTGRNSIDKIRYCLEHEGKIFEIDVFSFWNDRAIMEIELDSETEEFELPPQIEIIKEISTDFRYTNASLAKKIPYEIIEE